jgi:hypothetical protein
MKRESILAAVIGAAAALGTEALLRHPEPASAQAAQAFEYKVSAAGGTAKAVEDALNKLGGEGWLFCGYLPESRAAVFERRK